MIAVTPACRRVAAWRQGADKDALLWAPLPWRTQGLADRTQKALKQNLEPPSLSLKCLSQAGPGTGPRASGPRPPASWPWPLAPGPRPLAATGNRGRRPTSKTKWKSSRSPAPGPRSPAPGPRPAAPGLSPPALAPGPRSRSPDPGSRPPAPGPRRLAPTAGPRPLATKRRTYKFPAPLCPPWVFQRAEKTKRVVDPLFLMFKIFTKILPKSHQNITKILPKTRLCLVIFWLIFG